jgi:hypothetical protein
MNMSSTPKITISIPDAGLLEWMQARAESEDKSLSAVIVAAMQFERQLEARRAYLASWPDRVKLTPEDRVAIQSEWEGGPRWEPKPAKKKAPRAAAKKRRAA